MVADAEESGNPVCGGLRAEPTNAVINSRNSIHKRWSVQKPEATGRNPGHPTGLGNVGKAQLAVLRLEFHLL